MTIQQTLLADELPIGVAIENAYFRFQKVRIIRELQGEAPREGEEDTRTHRYLARIMVCVYNGDPGKQGKSILDKEFDADLTEVEAMSGGTFVDKIYNYLSTVEYFASGTQV